MRIFISGGCKNGKSTFAQRLAKQQQEDSNNTSLYYVAAMNAQDSEDEERIAKHRREREGWGFTTIEQYSRIEGILERCDPKGSFLLDSLTALLANEMFTAKEGVNLHAHEQISRGLLLLLNQISRIVIVSDYIYSDAFVYDPLTEAYRKSLAALDRLAAAHCDVVLEAAYTQIIVHKGTVP